MRSRFATLILFAILLAFGVTAGLAWAWLVAPPNPVNTSPADLNPVDREIYLRLVADGFATNGDQVAAARRMTALGDQAEAQLVDLIAADLKSGSSSRQTSHLAALAAALGIDASHVSLLVPPRPLAAATTSSPAEPVQSPTAFSSFEDNRFERIAQDTLCVSGESVRQIEFVVADANGEPLPGVAITIRWPGGEETIFTGFTPSENDGYADFEMEPGVGYIVNVEEDEPVIGIIQVESCPDGQNGGRRLEFRERLP